MRSFAALSLTFREFINASVKTARKVSLLLAFALFWPSFSAAALPTFLHDPAALDDTTLARAAKPALAAKIVTIVDKPAPSPTGDPHDYISYGRYWWPDPAKPDGLPYIRRDGQHNRKQLELGDRARLDTFINTVGTLALAWHRWRRAEDAVRAGEWLRTWLIARETRMKPALDYSQIRLGRDGNRGSAAGVLEGRGLTALVDALRLLHDSPALKAEEEASVRQWFADYYHWLQTAPTARAEQAAANNHGSWFLVQAVVIARYLGKDDEARRLCEEDFARIGRQFRRDGSQPLELARADALGYSHFNLEAQLQLARLARDLGVDLWNYEAPEGGSLKAGVAYVRPYNAAPEKWPHPQNEKLKPGFMDGMLAEAAGLDRGGAR